MNFSRIALLSSAAILLGSVLATQKPEIEESQWYIAKVKNNPAIPAIDLLDARVGYYLKDPATYAEKVNAGEDNVPQEMTNIPSWGTGNRTQVEKLIKFYPTAVKANGLLSPDSADKSVLDFQEIIKWSIRRCATENYSGLGGNFDNHQEILAKIFEVLSSESPSLIKYVHNQLDTNYLKSKKDPKEWQSSEIKKALNKIFTAPDFKTKKADFKAQDEKIKALSDSSSSLSTSSSEPDSSATLTSDPSSSSALTSPPGSSLSNTGSSSSSSISDPSTTTGGPKKSPTDEGKGQQAGGSDQPPQDGTNAQDEEGFWNPLTIFLVAIAGLAIIAVIVVIVVKFCCKKEDIECDVEDKI